MCPWMDSCFFVNWSVVYVEIFMDGCWDSRMMMMMGQHQKGLSLDVFPLALSWTSALMCSLLYFSVQQLAVDDVVSRCATVLGDWVIYGVVRKKQNKGKNHQNPFWRNLQTQVAAVGVNAAGSPGDTGVHFRLLAPNEPGRSCLFQNLESPRVLKGRACSKPADSFVRRCSTCSEKTLQAEGGGVVKSTQQVCAPKKKKKSQRQLARMKMSQVEGERWEQTHAHYRLATEPNGVTMLEIRREKGSRQACKPYKRDEERGGLLGLFFLLMCTSAGSGSGEAPC